MPFTLASGLLTRANFADAVKSFLDTIETALGNKLDTTTASATYETIANVAAIEGRVDTLEAAPGGGAGTVITQAAYDALVTPDPDTTYLIVG